ncbi:MAG TPA: ShlB/FhaC/HecB family hemolysin secretion/activation protein [Burkholderiaceae bacterium]|nr:ShlB/FhaC/HecB family hemolysin secretion/activation protein [Burkholderiaceae bacterium]
MNVLSGRAALTVAIAWACASWGLPRPAAAQTGLLPPPSLDAGALQQRAIDEEQRRAREASSRIPRVDKPLDSAEPARSSPATETLLATRIRVGEIVFSPSKFLNADELAALAKPLVGRLATIGELRALVARIDALYRERGVPTARAVLPPQEVTNGRVFIRLVEGTLGKISLAGNATTDTGYVTNRLGVQPGETIDVGALEDDLVWFNRTNDAQLRAQLTPGADGGTTDLNLALIEPPALGLRLNVDNGGPDATGRTRGSVVGTWRSPLGQRDELSAGLLGSDGTFGWFASYAVPFNRYGGRVGFTHNQDRNDIRHGPFAGLGLNGESSTQTLSLRQPLIVTNALYFDVSLAGRWRESKNRVEDIELQRTRTEDATLAFDANYTAATRWSFGGGLSASSLKARIDDPFGNLSDRNFTIVRTNARAQWELGHGVSARVLGVAQATGDERLPASEQFFLGGDGTVRGYTPSLVAGDRGWYANAELHHPLWSPRFMNEQGVALRGFAFYDTGNARPYRTPTSSLPRSETIASAGWGLSLQWTRGLSTRVAIAYRLKDRDDETRGNPGVHVQASYALF